MTFYEKTHNIIINNKYYVVHEEILKYCHYFDSILKGNFVEKQIILNFDIKKEIDFSIVIDIFYRYHICVKQYHGRISDKYKCYFGTNIYSKIICIFLINMNVRLKILSVS